MKLISTQSDFKIKRYRSKTSEKNEFRLVSFLIIFVE
jgi:hypothetical protein